MTDEKRKAERHFNWQAIRESVERMKPELIAASEAAHKAKDAASDVDDPGYADFERMVEVGYLVESLSGLCGPHLLLLNQYCCLTKLRTLSTNYTTRKRGTDRKHHTTSIDPHPGMPNRFKFDQR